MRNKSGKMKVLAISLGFFLVIALFPGGIFAAPPSEFNIADGNIIIQPGVGDNAGKVSITWGATPNTVYFEPEEPINITGTTTQNSVSVTGGVNAFLVLDGVTIELSGSAAPVSIKENSIVNMIIEGANRLIAGSYSNNAGLQVNSGNTLTILNSSSGELTAIGGRNGAGIGGGNAAGGLITINGGTIRATGGHNSAGIGGGANSFGGTIIINGGVVVAKGTVEGPGIGGGYYYNAQPSAVIQLNSGDITAISGSCGPAAIGGSCLGGAADITILSAATVRAVGKASGKSLQPIGNVLNANSTASVLIANFSVAKPSGTLSEVFTMSIDAVIGAAPATPSTYQSIAFTVPANTTYLLQAAGNYQQYTTSDSAVTDFVIGGAGLHTFNSVQDAPEGVDQAITFAAGDWQTKTFGDSGFELLASTSSGLMVTFTSSDTGVATISDGTVTIVGTGSTTITASQNGNAIYKPAPDVEHTLTIAPRAISVTADSQSKIYGKDDPQLTYEITTGSLVNDDSFSGSLTRDMGENVGSYAIEVGSLTLGDNYSIDFTGSALTIEPKQITITADAQSRKYGQQDPVLTCVIAAGALEAGDTLSGQIVREPGQNVGVYRIMKGTLAASDNYLIDFEEADFVISRYNQKHAHGSVRNGHDDKDGNTVSFVAEPNPGYAFAYWSDRTALYSTSQILVDPAADIDSYQPVFWPQGDASEQKTIQLNADETTTVSFHGGAVKMVLPARSDPEVVLSVTACDSANVYGTPEDMYEAPLYYCLMRSENLNDTVIRLEISLDQAGKNLKHIDLSRLQLFRWNDEEEIWEQTGIIAQGVDEEAGVIWAEVNNFSTFGVFYPIDAVEIPKTGEKYTPMALLAVLMSLGGLSTYKRKLKRRQEEA